MIRLNLPEYNADVRRSGERLEIFDPIRKKYIVLTPEEWVRQHMIHYLHNFCGYPLTLMRVEGGLKYNRLQKRSDILIYDLGGNPALLVECKSYKMQNLGEDVFLQAATYNRELKAAWLVITNGWGYHCWSVRDGNISSEKEIPAWDIINKQGL